MANLNTNSAHADQPWEQAMFLGRHMSSQQHTNMSLFWFSLEQHRLQMDQLLLVHNEQVRVSLQQQMSQQNATLLNLVEFMISHALVQKHDQIICLCTELLRMQGDLMTALHDRDECVQLAVEAYNVNQSLIGMLHSLQQERNPHVSSNELDATGSGHQALNMAGTAVETTQPNLICKTCNSVAACMLFLPCQHLCACKICGANLVTCPICNVVKAAAIEAQFG